MKMNVPSRAKESGFTFLELFVVLFVLGVIFGIGLVYYESTRSMRELNNDERRLTQALQRARYGAMHSGNRWGVELNEETRTVTVFNDDGWRGTLTQFDSIDKVLARREYFPGSADFDESQRENGLIDLVTLNGRQLRLEEVERYQLEGHTHLVDVEGRKLISFDEFGALGPDQDGSVPTVALIWLSPLPSDDFLELNPAERAVAGRAIAVLPFGSIRVLD